MEEHEDIASMLNTLKNRVEDLQIRVGEVLSKQLNTKKDLEQIREKPEDTEGQSVTDEEIVFPDDYHFTDELQVIMDNMINSQQMWMNSLEASRTHRAGLKGRKIFEEMNKHLTDRLEYLQKSKRLIQGPLLEELPPPPPPSPPAPEDEPPAEEQPPEGKKKDKKGDQPPEGKKKDKKEEKPPEGKKKDKKEEQPPEGKKKDKKEEPPPEGKKKDKKEEPPPEGKKKEKKGEQPSEGKKKEQPPEATKKEKKGKK